MIFKRETYLQKLVNHKNNGQIKIVTGIRRSGKSYLLFHLFVEHLLQEGVDDSHIIKVDLESRHNKVLRDPDVLMEYIDSKMIDQQMYYILLDEIQLVPEFEDVLNTYLKIENADVYVTGSNSRFLSTDIITEFRGRGDEIHLYPLSLSELWVAHADWSWETVWQQYMTYGGLPLVALMDDEADKFDYLKKLFKKTYLKDIKERHAIQNDAAIESLLKIVSSAVGSLTNPLKLEHAFLSNGKMKLSAVTIKQYLTYLEEAYLISIAQRYDIKGKQYLTTPYKCYFTDLGLRNANLNFRQVEETHLMENVIYNELLQRGYNVDVGVVDIRTMEESKQVRKQVEVDFVVNRGSQRYYIQSAFALPTPEKIEQEERPLNHISDSFKKIVVVKDDILLRRNEQGIVTMGLRQFLCNRNSLDL